MARSMLQHRSVPNKFWAEAMFTIVYLLNRSPSQCFEDPPHSVLLPLGQPNGRDNAASVFDDALPDLPLENNTPLVVHAVLEPPPSTPDIGSSTLRPKWWAKTIEAKGIPEWKQAMDAEFQSLQKNHTWTLSDLLTRKKPISCKWVYKVKYKADGTLDKYKARLVARGFSQKEGIDYEETFAPTAKMSTIWLVLALAAQFNWKVH
eukprot:PITA_13937